MCRRKGRPPRVEEKPSDCRREFRLTAEEDLALAQVARDNGVTVTHMIREAVNEYVADYSEVKERILR